MYIRFKLTLFLLRYEIAKEVNQEFKKPFQAPVVQTLDSAIRRINNYPADKYYGN